MDGLNLRNGKDKLNHGDDESKVDELDGLAEMNEVSRLPASSGVRGLVAKLQVLMDLLVNPVDNPEFLLAEVR